jgi:hypothetical protein
MGRHSGFQPKRKSIFGPKSNVSATNFTTSAQEFRRPAPDSTTCVPNFLLEICQRAPWFVRNTVMINPSDPVIKAENEVKQRLSSTPCMGHPRSDRHKGRRVTKWAGMLAQRWYVIGPGLIRNEMRPLYLQTLSQSWARLIRCIRRDEEEEGYDEVILFFTVFD